MTSYFRDDGNDIVSRAGTKLCHFKSHRDEIWQDCWTLLDNWLRDKYMQFWKMKQNAAEK